MKSISVALAAHMAQPLTTLATCWKVTRVDGLILGFTDHDKNLEVAGVMYEAAAGYSATDVASNNNLDVDNLEIQGLLVSPNITEADLRAGLWDGAQINIFMVNWADLTQGTLKMRVGRLGQVQQGRNSFRAELLGLMYAYQRSIIEVTQPGCRATFGDQRCKIDLTGSPSLSASGSADSFVDSTLTIVDADRTEATGYFNAGKVTFTGGLNAGLTFEVKEYTLGHIKIQTIPPYAIAAGDAYSIQRGCDKKKATCIGYGNIDNFRGEPDLQGMDKLLAAGRRT